MVILDANFLLFLLHDSLPSPEDPTTKKPVTECKERIEFLLSQLSKSKERVIVPTPVLAEVLVRAGNAASGWVEKISKSAAFKIADFDARAAVEVSCMAAADLSKKSKKVIAKRATAETYAKIKYDRQVVGISLVHKVTTLYTNDKNLSNLAKRHKIHTIGIHELSLSPKDRQQSFDWKVDENEEIGQEV